MSEFLDDQIRQLSKIFEGYKIDIGTLEDIVSSWEELPNRDINELSKVIESKIRNKTTIEIYEDDSGQYLLEMKFHPITIAWKLENNSKE